MAIETSITYIHLLTTGNELQARRVLAGLETQFSHLSFSVREGRIGTCWLVRMTPYNTTDQSIRDCFQFAQGFYACLRIHNRMS